MSVPVDVSRPVRIPADVEREDRVLGNLTARQVAILAVAALALYGGWLATRPVVPLVIYGVFAIPAACVVAVVAVGSQDGLSLDRLLLAAVAQHRTPALQLALEETEVQEVPRWVTANAHYEDQPTLGRGAAPLDPAALRLPGVPVLDSGPVRAGVIDLGADGVAAVCAASTLNFALRTATEQEALVAAFGRFLHSLTAPVQIVIAARRIDLTDRSEALRQRAGWLAHPALRDAAFEHAAFLDELGRERELLRREVLLVLREPLTPPGAHLAQRRAGRQPAVGDAAWVGAQTRLGRRVAEAAELLAGAGITISPLDAAEATAVLTAACNPDSPVTGALAHPQAVITTAGNTGVDTEREGGGSWFA